MTIMALEMNGTGVPAPAAPLTGNKRNNVNSKSAFTEADLVTWFEEVLGAKVFQDGVSAADTLRDGILLCRLMQALRPGSIKKYNAMKGAFFQLENINVFLQACNQVIGLDKHDLFDVRDLYDQSNFVKVLHTLELVHHAAKAPAAAANT
jgi:hypothetical protein